jgi:hypothetical protein
VRLDSNVTATLLHEPSDSSGTTSGVMVRPLRQASALAGNIELVWRDHQRAAKKRAYTITRGRPKQVQLYRELIGITRTSLAYVQQAAALIDRGKQSACRVLACRGLPLSQAEELPCRHRGGHLMAQALRHIGSIAALNSTDLFGSHFVL